MVKYIDGVCAVFLLCGVFFMMTGCSESHAGKNEFIVGKDIAVSEIKEFYYTIDASTNPPHFQRYRFTNKDGKYSFYHEQREGNTWPLTEKNITVSGTVMLSAEQWTNFVNCITEGKVTKRVDDTSTGGRGPWLYLYWNNDKGIYQVFNFATNEQKKGFESLCQKLKN